MSPRVNLDLITILKTAADIADTEGIDAVTMIELAKRLNVKSPSLYNHISGMGELRVNLAIYSMEQLYELLVRATIGKSKDDAIRSLSTAYVSFVRQHPGLYNAIIFAPNTDNDKFKIAADKIVDLLLLVLNSYDLEKDDQIHIVRGLRSMLHGFSSLEQTGGFAMPFNVDDSLSVMVDIFITGIHSIKNRK
ncbi:TetR/AcrR family transcriptional regulator [Clostridium folliculivorans]|uniref:TetR family transcriptional regulator n=1 Tax=Clostridium folliculivorans TaxID=2886038 RepID=A0A9W6DCI6_9CLOT|nr:TetR/AcrR family transcriptional regulator [Clostridium folliculivorans]GKU27032.1 TetR family transcriptional regulator [Clostridium folliculivorans]GKU29126.1 TetR family transcriptional regulator [Clostridium folliculivorans]